MPAHKLVSEPQERLLLDFLRANPALAVGRSTNAGPLVKQQVQKAWESVAKQLNALGSGMIKTPCKWRDYWAERKYALRRKTAIRAIATGTGNPAPRACRLTEVEEEILELIGKEHCKTYIVKQSVVNSSPQLPSASSPSPESPKASLHQDVPQEQPPDDTVNAQQSSSDASPAHTPEFTQQSNIEIQRLAIQAAMASAIDRLATAAEANTAAVERLAAASEMNTELLRLLLREFTDRQE